MEGEECNINLTKRPYQIIGDKYKTQLQRVSAHKLKPEKSKESSSSSSSSSSEEKALPPIDKNRAASPKLSKDNVVI